MRVAIVRKPIDTGALLDEVARARNGATVLFMGTVREQNDGRAVTGIEYVAYVDMAERELANIVRESCERFGTDEIVAVHRIGHLAIGETSVAIAAAHPHRDEAYAASRYVIEQIKVRLPVWKREAYVDGEREWVGGTGELAAGSGGGAGIDREAGIGNRESIREAGIGNRESAGRSEDPDAEKNSVTASPNSPSRSIPDSRFPIPDQFPLPDSQSV